MKRRDVLRSMGVAMVAPALKLNAAELHGIPQPTALDKRFLPSVVRPGRPMEVFARDLDRRNIAAVFDRLIPGDELGASASEAGCVDFLDAQLSGPFGNGSTLYRQGPKSPDEDVLAQKPQFIATPRERYTSGLKALEAYAQQTHQASFADLSPAVQDSILAGMEDGSISLAPEVNTKAFFELMLMNVREGYFSDPIYGGNRDMVGWKMVGFPGARYDYRPYADRTGQKLGLEPVSLIPKD
jgi:gluconate 2-dehydrogenase gamma chain